MIFHHNISAEPYIFTAFGSLHTVHIFMIYITNLISNLHR